jgi:hypothetical protein
MNKKQVPNLSHYFSFVLLWQRVMSQFYHNIRRYKTGVRPPGKLRFGPHVEVGTTGPAVGAEINRHSRGQMSPQRHPTALEPFGLDWIFYRYKFSDIRQ